MTALVYQWRTGNRFELLIDGDNFFPRILAALDQAVERIDIELYLVDSGRSTRQWLEALQHARRRGVQVRCLLDAIGPLKHAL